MQRKRVIFHLGAHKTASTYLQSVFSQQADNLKSHDIDYPYPETQEVINSSACVGNVVKMLYLNKVISQENNASVMAPLGKLWSLKCNDFIIDTVKNSDCQTVLFSSEGICRLQQPIFDDLYKKLNAVCEPEFIIFVRDPYDYFYSSWAQTVKATYNTKAFSEFTNRRIKNHQKGSTGLFFNIDISSTAKHKIVNFDSYKKDIATNFFSIADIEIDFKLNDSALSESMFQNRSLSPSEAQLQSLVNQQFSDSQFPAFVRALLLSRSDYKPAIKKYYKKETDQLIMDEFVADINQLNKHIIGDNLRTECRNLQTTELIIEPQDVEVLINAFKQITTQNTEKTALSKLKHWAKCILLKHVPLDFDPKAYLFLNKDVSAADIDPYFHYSQNGHCEGRPYRLF